MAVDLVCFLGWSGELDYEGPSLEAKTCWNDRCSGMLTATVMTAAPPAPASASEEAYQAPDDEDIIEECERPVIEGAQTPLPCGGPLEVEPSGERFPGGVSSGCGFDDQHSDFLVRACATSAHAGSTSVSILIWPDQYTSGQGQDLLRDGDQLSLRLEGVDGVLVDEVVTIDEYDVSSEGNASCKSAGFGLDGERH